MTDIRLQFDVDALNITACTEVGREVLKSILGRFEASVPWRQAKPLLDRLEYATEHHNVTVGA